MQWYTSKQCLVSLPQQWSQQQRQSVAAAQGGEVARAMTAYIMAASLHEWETQLAQVVQTPTGG